MFKTKKGFKKMKMEQRKYREIILGTAVFGAVFLSFFLLNTFMKAPKYYYDAIIYWFAGDSMFTADGAVNFAGYSEPYIFRGYFLPFFYKMLRGFTTADTSRVFIFNVNNALIWSVLTCFFLPEIAKKIFNSKSKKWLSVILCWMIIILWYGSIIYTLSDGYAFFFLIFDVLLLIKYFESKSFSGRAVYCFLIGTVSYCIYNIRTMYIVSVVLIFLILLINTMFTKRKWGEKLFCPVLFFAGVFFCGIPQMIINLKYLGEVSVRVPTEYFANNGGGGDGLLVSQLFWGLGTQRYETYIGTEYLHPGMEFIDAIGRKILQEAGNIEYNLKELISIYFKHPLDCLGIYMRHFINAFDNRFPELYIKDLNKNRDLYVFINYTILYVWIFTVIMRGKERLKAGKKLFEYHNRLQILYLSVLVLPSLLTTAGALEIRFYMPVWFIIYTYIIFVTDYKKLLKKVREKPVQTAVSYLLGFAVLVSLWGGCMGTLLDGAIL